MTSRNTRSKAKKRKRKRRRKRRRIRGMTAFLETVLLEDGSLLQQLQNLQNNGRLKTADVIKNFAMDMFNKNNLGLPTIPSTLSYAKSEVNTLLSKPVCTALMTYSSLIGF